MLNVNIGMVIYGAKCVNEAVKTRRGKGTGRLILSATQTGEAAGQERIYSPLGSIVLLFLCRTGI